MTLPLEIPQWLNQAKVESSSTPEWQALVKNLHQLVMVEIDRYIGQSNKGARTARFSDLSTEEQAVIVQDIFDRCIERTGQNVFERFSTKLQTNLEGALLTEVTKGKKGIGDAGSIIQLASEGAVSTLQFLSSANQRSVMPLLLNVELTPQMRRNVWHVYLGEQHVKLNPEHEESAMSKRSFRWLDSVSKYDVIITQNAERLVRFSHFKEAFTSTKIMMLKSIISYHTAVTGDVALPENTVYWLAMPLVLIYADHQHQQQTSSSSSSNSGAQHHQYLPLQQQQTTLVDMAAALKMLLSTVFPPRTVIDDLACLETSLILQSIKGLLRQHDGEVARHMEALGLRMMNKEAHTGASTVSAEKGLLHVLKGLCVPSLSYGLVNLLSLQEMTFVWDQCLIIGFQVMLPRLFFALLVTLRDALIQTQDVEEMQTVIQSRSPHVKVSQLQHIMSKYCLDEIRQELQMPDGSRFLQVSYGGGAPHSAQQQRGDNEGGKEGSSMLDNLLGKNNNSLMMHDKEELLPPATATAAATKRPNESAIHQQLSKGPEEVDIQQQATIKRKGSSREDKASILRRLSSQSRSMLSLDEGRSKEREPAILSSIGASLDGGSNSSSIVPPPVITSFLPPPASSSSSTAETTKSPTALLLSLKEASSTQGHQQQASLISDNKLLLPAATTVVTAEASVLPTASASPTATSRSSTTENPTSPSPSALKGSSGSRKGILSSPTGKKEASPPPPTSPTSATAAAKSPTNKKTISQFFFGGGGPKK